MAKRACGGRRGNRPADMSQTCQYPAKASDFDSMQWMSEISNLDHATASALLTKTVNVFS